MPCVSSRSFINSFPLTFKDSVRAETLFASFAKAGHPWRLFGWGNLKSLGEEPQRHSVELQPELRRFFAQHYQVRDEM